MDLTENPFHILGVSIRDPSQKVLRSAEEKSLFLDPEICTRAKTALTNPKQRIAAEIAWLPGLAPGRAEELVEKLPKGPAEFENLLNGLPPLVRCNVGIAIIKRLSFRNEPSAFHRWVILISDWFESINVSEVLVSINEDREIARFPVIPDSDDIEEQLHNRRKYFVQIFSRMLKKGALQD